jgi:hypothetical protein
MAGQCMVHAFTIGQVGKAFLLHQIFSSSCLAWSIQGGLGFSILLHENKIHHCFQFELLFDSHWTYSEMQAIV